MIKNKTVRKTARRPDRGVKSSSASAFGRKPPAYTCIIHIRFSSDFPHHQQIPNDPRTLFTRDHLQDWRHRKKNKPKTCSAGDRGNRVCTCNNTCFFPLRRRRATDVDRVAVWPCTVRGRVARRSRRPHPSVDGPVHHARRAVYHAHHPVLLRRPADRDLSGQRGGHCSARCLHTGANHTRVKPNNNNNNNSKRIRFMHAREVRR